MNANDLQAGIGRIALLAEPARQQLYLYVSSRDGEISREEAARAAGLSRRLAAFHLDKLVEAGMLEVSFRRLSGKTGPGAGRPAKLYRRSRRRVGIALPTPEEPVAARILARALEEGASIESLEHAAHSWGVTIGREARARAGADATRPRLLDRALDALGEAGFDPRVAEDGRVVLARCPFEADGSEARVRICHLNLALCRGVVEGLDAPPWSVRLEPAPGRCCAVFSP